MIILYLHGFRSSPQSTKAQQLASHMRSLNLADQIYMPQLPISPAQAMRECLALGQSLQTANPKATLMLVGSSLGGYYATWLAQRFDCRAVLINPCVYAVRDLATQLEPTTYYHNQEPFEFQAQHVRELAQFFLPVIQPERYLLLLGMADELLDWREASQRFAGSQQISVANEGHSFSSFDKYLPQVLSFAQ